MKCTSQLLTTSINNQRIIIKAVTGKIKTFKFNSTKNMKIKHKKKRVSLNMVIPSKESKGRDSRERRRLNKKSNTTRPGIVLRINQRRTFLFPIFFSHLCNIHFACSNNNYPSISLSSILQTRKNDLFCKSG